jgi:hypothetical protein
MAWHPYLEVVTQRIQIGENGKENVHFEMDASDVEIPFYSVQKGYRLDTTLKPDQIVPPAVELQKE